MATLALNPEGDVVRDAAAGETTDPSDTSQATHLPVSRLNIGNWTLVAKHEEHVLLSLYWAERKLVWEVLHLGVVRKMEVDFEDVVGMDLSSAGPDESERLQVELGRPPRFYREAPGGAGGSTNYVYTTDFTSGQASQVSRHVLHFPNGTVSPSVTAMKRAGLPVRVDGAGSAPGTSVGAIRQLEAAMRGAGGVHSVGAKLRQPPTSSPRLDAIILQEQLEREMHECQARYTGICPVRERIYAAALDELLYVISRDEPKRGKILRRVHAEARMSVDAYRAVFERSLGFGQQKLSVAVETKGDLEEQVAGLEAEISDLNAQVKQLTDLCESLEHRAEKNAAPAVSEEEIALKAETKQLTDLRDALEASDPRKSKK